MKFQKGSSGNPAGKKPGCKNKVTNDLRNLISDFLNEEFGTIQDAFRKLSAEKKVRYYLQLLEFGVPKLSSVKNEIQFELLNDEQLDLLLQSLKLKAHDEERKN